jgi:hypothetical protein
MSKYVEYASEECLFLMELWDNDLDFDVSKGFSQWAAAHSITVHWNELEHFLEFEDEKQKLAFFLKWC